MRKFVVRLADGSEQCLIRPLYDTRNEAIQGIMDYVAKYNEDLGMEDSGRISPFDFKIDDVDVEDIGDVIPDFKSASKYIGLMSHDGLMVFSWKDDKDFPSTRDIDRLVRDINPRHVDALIALNELFTIAEAWNKVDGFVPDFANKAQRKYSPCFVYNRDVIEFESSDRQYTPMYDHTVIGSRLCFKTEARAIQFGLRFAGLFNKFLMIDRREEVSDGR